MRPRYASLIVVVLAALGAAGCRPSARTLKMAGIEITTEPAIELTHDGWVFCGSSDGRYFTEWKELSKGEGVVEVRDYASRSLKLSIRVGEDGPVPLLFDRRCENLLVAGGNENRDLVAYSLADGASRTILTADERLDQTQGDESNGDSTIIARFHDGRTLLVTAAGTVHAVPGRAMFDPEGNAWFKEGGVWGKVGKDGRKTAAAAPPAWLVEDQSRIRGPMRLVEQKDEIRHRGASACVTVVWIECTKAGKTQAALVHAVPDPLLTYGFVAGRNAVYCLTETGTSMIPYTIKRTGR